jgi:hypothetical protein
MGKAGEKRQQISIPLPIAGKKYLREEQIKIFD